ncbi:MAG: twin-arginine translocase subunit TatC, partial [Verrucomicrobiota bacterium]
MNFLLKKLFGVREKVASRGGLDTAEMPFLDHLEELRETLFRVLLTLLIGTVLCFVFREQLMAIVKYPVKLAELGLDENEYLPVELKGEDWIEIKELSGAAVGLSGGQRTAFLEASTKEKPTYRPYLEALPVYRAAVRLPEEVRSGFVEQALEAGKARDTARLFLRLGPEGELDREKGNLLVMDAFDPVEPFMLSIKLAIYSGVILSFPFLLFFLSQFIFPGLTGKEKRAVIPALMVGSGLFLIGVFFAYYVVTPLALKFFYNYGEERRSRQIARVLVEKRPFRTTTELARAISANTPHRYRSGSIHPATRVFQALRIAVNAELDNLEIFLEKAPVSLVPGGRIALIDFHSLEDRLIKHRLRSSSLLQVLTKKPIRPGAEELADNPRSR